MSINYELAKKLKEAGLPIRIEDIGEMTWVPTLEELIEACGRNFRLQNSTPGMWQADTCGDFEQWDEGKHIRGIGSTPAEAVANLYLALHEKEKTKEA